MKMDKLERMDVAQRLTKLKLKAATRYNIGPDMCHIGHLVLEAFYQDPNFVHQIDAGTEESSTNLQIATLSTQLASALKNSGLRPGDAAVIMGLNHLKLSPPFYACFYNGYGACTMHPTNTQNDIVALFSYVQPKVVFCSKEKEGDVQLAVSKNNLKCRIITFDGDYNLDVFIKDFKGSEKGFRPEVFDHSKTNALLMLTSGTTGLPKAAIVTFEAILDAVTGFLINSPFKVPVFLTMGTLQWISTIITFLATPLTKSTRVQTSKQLTGSHLRDMINKYKPNTTVFARLILRQFLQEEGDTCDMSSLMLVFIGGSVVNKSLLDQLQAKVGGVVLNTYTMTELLSPIFRYIPGIVPEGSVGLHIPEKFQYRLIDDDGNDISKPNETGELWVKGESFFKGYLNNPVETEKMITPDGWVKTGDLFSRDEKNFYYFKERRRLLIKYMSRFVAPIEIEDIIQKHSGVAEACVVGIPHPDCGELPVAAITKKNGNDIQPSEIFSLIKEELPELKHLHGGLFFVDSLPMTPSGKIDRKEVLKMALNAERILPNGLN